MKSLSIDPSINNVGWSLFDSKAETKQEAWLWGTIHPTGANLEMRITDTIQQLSDLFTWDVLDYLITERPAFFSSERGQIAAHMNYTIDLAAVAYYIAGWFHMDHRKHFAITANQWKGSVPKAVTARRFFASFPKVDVNTLDEHAIDAVMLHKWWLENVATVTTRVLRRVQLDELVRFC
jgi:Holliday junction resolvasome RuvABC endonuclease subunit